MWEGRRTQVPVGAEAQELVGARDGPVRTPTPRPGESGGSTFGPVVGVFLMVLPVTGVPVDLFSLG